MLFGIIVLIVIFYVVQQKVTTELRIFDAEVDFDIRFDDHSPNFVFCRIWVLSPPSNLLEKSTFMTIQQIWISKLNSTSKITSNIRKSIQNAFRILIVELIGVLNSTLLTAATPF